MPSRRILLLCALAGAALTAPVQAPAAERQVTSQPAVHFGEVPGKAVGDTIDLMGPGGDYPYRGDFETAGARPDGDGLLTDGWTSVDLTAAIRHWHVDTYGVVPPLAGNVAWCGDIAYASCGGGDPAGGYGNEWYGILEFRKSVGAAATVRVQADLVYDTEPAYDYVMLQRRTSAHEGFEYLSGGQGEYWTGRGTAAVDYTFTYTQDELYAGTDVAVAFVFTSDAVWSDGDCGWPTAGGARVDGITVTVNGVAYTEDFEDGGIGPDWTNASGAGVGDFARVWSRLGDADDCASNYSNLIAFIDDGLVVPGTGGTVGAPGNDYGPAGGYIVNNTGGLLGPSHHLDNAVYSPVMTWPDPAKGGMSFAFDVYRHELLIPDDTPGILYTWSVRSTSGGDIHVADWKNRNFVYYGGPSYLRSVNVVDDLIVPDPTQCQVALGVYEAGWQFGYGEGTNGTPAPYFDNVRVKVYPSSGPRIAVTETRLANDGFPAGGTLDPVNLGANAIRFDMAANISARSHARNDPGDSICVDVTPRSGGTLTGPPRMHWTFAIRNPLFDAYRTLPPNPVVGQVTRTAAGTVVANRFNFDVPDTGMIFPGDQLHYYFSAQDNVAGDVRTATAPGAAALAGFGDRTPLAYPGLYTVNGLPSIDSIYNGHVLQPTVLFWNDAGFGDHEAAWYGALAYSCLAPGSGVDVYDTHGPTSGVGNGLGGRATASQLAGYTTILYTSGDLSKFTLSNGDVLGDPGNDIALLGDWLAMGGRNLLLFGDDLAADLQAAGAAGQAFLEGTMGATFVDGDVRDNIAGQVAPVVVTTEPNPVFELTSAWVADGGCPGINDFDGVVPFGGAVRLAEFTAPDRVATPYPYAAAMLNALGTNRIVSLSHDLGCVRHAHGLSAGAGAPGDKSPAPPTASQRLLRDALVYFGEMPGGTCDPTSGTDLPGASTRFAVAAHPNPFNPRVTVDWTLPRPGHLTVRVYDVRGALVRTLHDAVVAATAGRLAWDGRDDGDRNLPSGLYFVETRAEGAVDVRKVTLLR
ncbi:MAG: hypothetical protein IPK64_02825 [bacterium]|nr:hypothetical protein [bacterium]